MAIQLIRLSQIRASLPQFMDFEQQIAAMYGSDDMLKLIANDQQQTFILDREYPVGKNAIKVFVNGLLQTCGAQEGYMEVNSRMISFTEPLYKDDVVVIIFNNFNRFADQIGKERVKAYEIYRQTYFVTDLNKDNLTYLTPVSYQPGLNQLKVYQNGLLLVPGQSYHYTERDDTSFTLNAPLQVGTTLTVEVTTGGLMVYKADRFPVFIDANKVGQRTILLPVSYKLGLNSLKVYLNGQLLRPGADNDYIETDDRSFTMNYDIPLGAILEAEVTTFTVDVFKIYRNARVITNGNQGSTEFPTIVPFHMGESNLRVYLNGVLMREGVGEDYVEVNESRFKMNYSLLPIGSVVEYEIISW